MYDDNRLTKQQQTNHSGPLFFFASNNKGEIVDDKGLEILLLLTPGAQLKLSLCRRGRRGCNRMVIEFTNCCAISAYHR
jgi:hypothetical protein